MLVRVAVADDLGRLIAELPAPPGVHASRLARQAEGEGLFLLVTDSADGGRFVGSAFLKTTGPMNGQIAAAHADVPELVHIQVAERAQGRGAGTALVEAAAGHARRLGFDTLGISVGLANPRAWALYERLGFAETGLWTTTAYRTADGVEHTETDAFLTRRVG